MEMKAPTKFRTAATPTAIFGFNAPVAIEVAIAFAVSWNPLVKSKTSATATTSTTMMSPVLTRRNLLAVRPAAGRRSQVVDECGRRTRFDPPGMADEVIHETEARLEARLQELRPAIDEAARIEAALAALRGNGPRPPVTALDMLKPVDGSG
jgi:hypothetical protein